VDEDLPRGVADVLCDAGYDAKTVHEQGLTGYDDGRLWVRVQEEDRLLMTADKGFADVRSHPPGAHHGIVLLRLEHESRRGYIELVAQLLATTALDELVGTVAVATPERLRVRRR
jgi:predicted nuclease of predicted toxin-antitoxin system